MGISVAVEVCIVVRVVLGSVRTGIQDWQIKLDTARVVRRLERMSTVELGAQGGFPLLGGHEGVAEGSGFGAEVKRGLVGYGSTQVGGIGRFQLHRVLSGITGRGIWAVICGGDL